MLGRFLVFAYDAFYPSGGMNDFIGDFEDIADFEEIKSIVNKKRNYYQIYDSKEFTTYEFEDYGEFEAKKYSTLIGK